MHDAIAKAIQENTSAIKGLTSLLHSQLATREDVRCMGLALVSAIDALRDEVHEKSLHAVAVQTDKLHKSADALRKAVDQSKPE